MLKYLVVLMALASSALAENTVTILHEGYDRFPKVGSTVTLIRAGDALIVTDPGMVEYRDLILNALAENGASPEQITHVFVTHQHMDHTANVGMFPNAQIIDALGVYTDNHWKEYDPDGYVVAPGVTVMATPGHTNEDASLLVETADGTYAITHAWWHDNFTPKIDPFAEDAAALTISRARLIEAADWIIPSHGGAVRSPKE